MNFLRFAFRPVCFIEHLIDLFSFFFVGLMFMFVA